MFTTLSSPGAKTPCITSGNGWDGTNDTTRVRIPRTHTNYKKKNPISLLHKRSPTCPPRRRHRSGLTQNQTSGTSPRAKHPQERERNKAKTRVTRENAHHRCAQKISGPTRRMGVVWKMPRKGIRIGRNMGKVTEVTQLL